MAWFRSIEGAASTQTFTWPPASALARDISCEKTHIRNCVIWHRDRDGLYYECWRGINHLFVNWRGIKNWEWWDEPSLLIPNMSGRDQEKMSFSLVDFCLLYNIFISCKFAKSFFSVRLSAFTHERWPYRDSRGPEILLFSLKWCNGMENPSRAGSCRTRGKRKNWRKEGTVLMTLCFCCVETVISEIADYGQLQ